MTDMELTTMASPIGHLVLTSNGRALTGVRTYVDPAELPAGAARPGNGVLADAAAQLKAFFAGERRSFDVELEPYGTQFQLRVWRALEEIPYGHTAGYGEVAWRVGNPKAARAVGLASARNPIAVVVPCHRVIGANGSLTGYAGGLESKRYLLDLEARAAATG
jgi:methylated-DNA-[protein]-cysteine S-methyltransferase